MADVQRLVLDIGSGFCKAGFAGDAEPIAHFPSVVGYPRNFGSRIMGKEDKLIGAAAYEKRGVMTLRHPIERGNVTNWDDMEKIWHHTFYNELRVDPKEHPVLLTEAPLTSPVCRDKTTQIMFETHKVPSLKIMNKAVLSLLANNNDFTGVVVQSGYGVTVVVPVIDCFAPPHLSTPLSFAGHDLTESLMSLLFTRGYTLSSTAVYSISDMKEKVCFVSHSSELGKCGSQSYKLPDGLEITVDNERALCPEALFQPSLVGQDWIPGVHTAVQECILRCDSDLHKDLYKNVFFAGGNSKIPGITGRLKAELTTLAPPKTEVNVDVACKWRSHSSWTGGSLAALSSPTDSWFTRKEYDEYGPTYIREYFFDNYC